MFTVGNIKQLKHLEILKNFNKNKFYVYFYNFANENLDEIKQSKKFIKTLKIKSNLSQWFCHVFSCLS